MAAAYYMAKARVDRAPCRAKEHVASPASSIADTSPASIVVGGDDDISIDTVDDDCSIADRLFPFSQIWSFPSLV